MPANARNMTLESKPSDVGCEKKPNRDGHEVIAHTNKDDAVCNLEYNVHYNIRTKGNASLWHGHTEVQQQVSVVEHYSRRLQEAGEISVAGVIDPGNLTPKMLDDNEQEPVPRAVEGCDEATIMSDQSQGSQQDKDTMQSQT